VVPTTRMTYGGLRSKNRESVGTGGGYKSPKRKGKPRGLSHPTRLGPARKGTCLGHPRHNQLGPVKKRPPASSVDIGENTISTTVRHVGWGRVNRQTQAGVTCIIITVERRHRIETWDCMCTKQTGGGGHWSPVGSGEGNEKIRGAKEKGEGSLEICSNTRKHKRPLHTGGGMRRSPPGGGGEGFPPPCLL